MLTPVFGSLEGFGDGLLICMFLPVALVLLLLFVWWAILGIFLKERRDALRDRSNATESATPTTIPELIDMVHRKAVSRLLSRQVRERVKSRDPGLRRDVTRVIEHLLDCENPMLTQLEREEAINAVVDRMLGPRPE